MANYWWWLTKDDTKNIVKDFKDENKIEIKYFYQEKLRKMLAINKLVKEANGDLIIGVWFWWLFYRRHLIL